MYLLSYFKVSVSAMTECLFYKLKCLPTHSSEMDRNFRQCISIVLILAEKSRMLMLDYFKLFLLTASIFK